MNIWNWDTFSGLSDDSFLGRKGEFLNCTDIDILNNPRFVSGALNRGNVTSIGSTIKGIRDGTIPIFWGTGTAYWGFGGVSAGSLYVDTAEQIGTTTLPVTYWFQDTQCTQQKYNGATVTTIGNITTNYATGTKTASCIGAGRIYYAVGNSIYVINTTTSPDTTLSTANSAAANSNIPFGYTIKYMYIYMDIMNVVTTDGKDTIIYQLTEDTTDSWTIRYYHRIKGAVVLGAVGNLSTIYWFTKDSIYISNGVESQKVKKINSSYGSSPLQNGFCTFYDGELRIAVQSSGYVFKYGHRLPGYNDVLITNTAGMGYTAMDGEIFAMNTGSNNYIVRESTTFSNYASQWTITSLPYEAGDFLMEKANTGIRIGFILPEYADYSSTTTTCSIKLSVITDVMEQKGLTAFVDIETFSTPTTGVSKNYADISWSTIANALSSAGHTPDFNYIKLKITGYNGDPTTTTGMGTIYRKTPKFMGIKLYHDTINESQPN